MYLFNKYNQSYINFNYFQLIAMKTKCPKYDKEFADVHKSTKVQNYNKEYANLYQYLTKNTGMIVDNIETVESLFNTLEIQQLNNLTLPQWANDSIMSQMKIIGAQNLALYSETEYMKKVKGGFFIKTVTDLMQKILNESNTPSINLYSGHDLTLVHVMRALHLIDIIKPEFGASLVIELYDNSEIKVSLCLNIRANIFIIHFSGILYKQLEWKFPRKNVRRMQ